MSLLKGVLKGLRAPMTITALLADQYVWPAWLRAQGVEFGPGLKLVGGPDVRLTPGGKIHLGSNVSLYSRRASNPLLLHHPCALRLLASNACISIGSGSALSGTVICAATSVEIGEHVLIGANCKISDTDFHPLSPEARRHDRNQGAQTEPIVIENDVFIGAHAFILKGSRLGVGCVVGAGAVVAGTFPPRSVIAGNPARIIRQLSTEGMAP
ncbi:MAG: acyltransferase [Chloroflexi bacterium]|nr:acyltransferase [Chloroflexota bacterium]